MNARHFRTVLGVALATLLTFPLSAATSAQGVESLRRKAEAGNAIAQYNLGLIYADATEPQHDLIEAYVWLSRAANNGARGRQLNLVAEQLTAQQRADANRRLGAAPAAASTVTAAPPRQPSTTTTTTATPRAASSPFASVPLEGDDAEISRLQRERDQLVRDLNSVRIELEQLRASGAGSQAELRKRVAIAETALDNRESEIANLNAQLTALRTGGRSQCRRQ